MRIPHETFDNGFQGICVFHGDCLEGIASGYAMQQRYGRQAEEINDTYVWDLEASYIASAINNLMMAVGPERIVLGGGLINHAGLMENIRAEVLKTINGYMPFPELNTYIVSSSGEENGVRGAIKLATLL